ncbi:MAG TPA: hypothetical protein VEG84_07355 [Thermoanaerobaculia bacterium]|nr:hypothetical protein [Thermoanaerobaculia bacterium]
MIHFAAPAGSDWTLREYLSRWGHAVAKRFRLIPYEDLLQAGSFEPGAYVLSSLCSIPDHMRRSLERLHASLCREAGFRFLNHPTKTLTRLPLLEELSRRGLNGFRAARATNGFGHLRFPVFLRSERTHDGALSPLLHSRSAVEASIGRALVRGRPLRDLLVVEFCDTSDTNGYFRKYSAYVVGDRVLPRSLEYGRPWVLKHEHCEFSQAQLAEERAYVLANPHEKQLSRIFAIAGVEYGRIDYAVKDGQVQTWEINLHPTIGRGRVATKSHVPPALEPFREESKAFFYRAFQSAWETIDPSEQPPRAVSLSLPTEPEPRASSRQGTSTLARVRRRAPRPLRHLALALTTPLLPAIGRLALRRARQRPDARVV